MVLPSSSIKILGKLIQSLTSYERTSKHTIKQDCYFIYILAWEPSAFQVNKRYSRRLPALDFNGKLNFCYKSRSTQLRLSNLIQEHSRGSPELTNQNLRKKTSNG